MARILRGEIRWANLNPVRGREQAGLRPVLILARTFLTRCSGTVIAHAPITEPASTSRFIHLLTIEVHRPLETPHGLRSAKFGPYSIERIGKRIGGSLRGDGSRR